MRAVRPENMSRNSYFSHWQQETLKQVIAIPTVNTRHLIFTDKGKRREKETETFIFIYLKNLYQIYTHQHHIYV